jgi:hypothetical protein
MKPTLLYAIALLELTAHAEKTTVVVDAKSGKPNSFTLIRIEVE